RRVDESCPPFGAATGACGEHGGHADRRADKGESQMSAALSLELPPLSPPATVVELRPTAERAELEAAVSAAERAVEEQRYADAVAVLGEARPGGAHPDIALRAQL